MKKLLGSAARYYLEAKYHLHYMSNSWVLKNNGIYYSISEGNFLISHVRGNITLNPLSGKYEGGLNGFGIFNLLVELGIPKKDQKKLPSLEEMKKWK